MKLGCIATRSESIAGCHVRAALLDLPALPPYAQNSVRLCPTIHPKT
jgi:hypothetical protein